MFAMRRARILDREDYEDSGNRSHWLPETAIRRENEFGGSLHYPTGQRPVVLGARPRRACNGSTRKVRELLPRSGMSSGWPRRLSAFRRLVRNSLVAIAQTFR